MTTESSEIIVRLLERKSNRTVAELSSWQSVKWTERWRRPGHGSIKVLADDVPAAAIQLLTADNLALQIFREWYGQKSDGTELKFVDEVAGPINSYVYETGDGNSITLKFADNLTYMADRTINTDGVANVDPGNVTAIEYVRSLLSSELIAPSDSDRAIDVPAVLAGLSAGGSVVDLPVRWQQLSDAIEQACIAGEIGVRTRINGLGQIEFSALPVRDRTTGNANAVVISARNEGAALKFAQDSRRVRNRVYVLGENEGSAREVETVTDSTFTTGDRLREMVVDARNLKTSAEYQARANTELAQRRESLRTIDVTEASREFNIQPGDKVTISEWFRRDSIGPDIVVDVLCLARTVSLSPGVVDKVRLEIGSEVPSSGLILKGIVKATEQTRFM